ncbi:MAG TPA: argininosuccinate lyase, partial [Pseudomonadales bacterium]|nr:argininosuccinate lyase [Pseudomonadales bacterium]
QPLAYNKDNQEDKEPLFDTIDTVTDSLTIFADMVGSIRVNAGRMRAAALEGFSTATDLADYLVKRGVPFRDAHHIVGRAVQHAIGQQLALSELPLELLRQFCASIDEDVYQVLTPEGSVAARDHLGGTAPRQVREAVARARTGLAGRAAAR